MFNSSKRSTLLLVLGLLIGALSAVFVVIIVAAKPVADDYSYFSVSYAKSPIGALSAFRFEGGARYAQAFDMALFFRLFGEKALAAYPLFLLGLLTLSILWAIVSFNKLLNIKLTAMSKVTYFLLACLASILTFFVVPSFIDTVLWFSSATVHMAGIVWAVFAIALTLDLCISLKNKRYRKDKFLFLAKYLTLSFVALFNFTHSEVANIAVGAIAACVIFIIIIKPFRLHGIGFIRKIDKNRLCCAIYLGLLALIPLLIMLFSPAVARRMAAIEQLGMEKLGVGQSLVGGIKWSLFLHEESYFNPLVVSSALLLAILAFFLIEHDLIKRIKQTVTPTFMITGALIGGLSFYASVTVDFIIVRGVNLRMMALPAAIAFFTWLFLWFSIVVLVHKQTRRLKSYKKIFPMTFCVAIALTAISFVPERYLVIKAVYRRQQLFNARVIAINQYKNGASDKLRLFPVLYLHKSDAQDVFYNNKQYDWIIPSIYSYYGLIKNDNNVTIDIGAQPLLYCDNVFESTESGIKKCNDLYFEKPEVPPSVTN